MTPTFREALLYWLKLGFVNFGGPTGQIAIMHRQLVEERRWIDEERFQHALSFCMLLPGPEAQQLAIYVGWLMHRAWGGIVAGVLFVLPGLAVLLAMSWAYVAYGNVPAVEGLFFGLKAAIVAVVAHAVGKLGGRALRRPVALGIAALAFLVLTFLLVPFPIVIVAAGLVGLVALRAPQDQPPLPGPRPSLRSGAVVVAGGAILWALPFALLVAWGDRVLADVALFFSQLAVVSFGGAYAALAYMAQQAVDHHGWLTTADMVAGLGLAESTPGPLILVVAFVGYLAAGPLGALVATWYTFLFSFVFILVGAPWVERLRGNRALSAALAGVTAAVVGVMLSLAVTFAGHVLFPTGALDAIALALAVAAFVALALRANLVLVVLGGALAGLATRALL